MRTPWVRGMQAALDDPRVHKVVDMKASQTAWTEGVLINYLLKRIDIDPCGIIGMFAKTGAADEFVDEKFAPAVIATPRMHSKIDVTTTRKAGNKKLFKKFSGGFLKLVGSNSPSSVKSTSAQVIFVEEPDDANTNVKGQGDTIKLLEDRKKTFSDGLMIYGGTPTIKELSAIEDAYKSSDQRKYFIPCHDCGDSHVLDWENVKWEQNSETKHEIYGHARPETGFYACPHCGSVWDDDQKNDNVQKAETTPGAGWQATAEFRGVAGFGHISELYAPFDGSRFIRLVERYLEARKKFDAGDDTDYITFVNTCLGLPYEYESDAPEVEDLAKRAEDYPELLVPNGGLILTVGIDVQHDRFAVIIRVWGRGEESWLVYWGEVFGTVTDQKNDVWHELEQLVFSAKQHENGFEIMPSAVSIDSSDGKTSDQVYNWVRLMQKKYAHVHVMAIKGESNNPDKEIYSTPKASVDPRSPTKAARYGLRIYMVGTNKGKDLISTRLQLTGAGPGRFHYYQEVRSDYYDQLTSEVKAPSRRMRNKLIWQLRSGKRNEALDCEDYALHAARSQKTHTLTPKQWDALELKLKQTDLFTQPQLVQQESKNTEEEIPKTVTIIEANDPWL